MRVLFVVALILSTEAAARSRRPSASEKIAAPDTFGAVAYQFSQSERIEVASGRTIVSATGRGHTPSSGWFPLRFNIDNTMGPTQTVRLSYRVVGSPPTEIVRVVEIEGGTSRAFTMSVPAEATYGSIEASSPIIGRQSTQISFSSIYDRGRLVLNLGTPDEFEAFIHDKPDNTSGEDQIVSMPLAEAPVELAGYVGTSAVVITDARGLEGLSAAQLSALEAWVALGGSLVLQSWPKTSGVLPLLRDGDAVRSYGLGAVAVTTGPAPLANVPIATLQVEPMNEAPVGGVRSYGKVDALLPQALVPVGRFLLIITLFTLLIGPGSVWLARKRGPAILLASIPATAFATCVLILGSSLLIDGFTVHASTYGYTLLDSNNHRAATVGLSAWYANLAPRSASLEASSALVAPTRSGERTGLELEWSDGAKLKSGFVPSRTYREWGHLSVSPTRARLITKQKGDSVVLQNGLGHSVALVYVQLGDQLYSAEKLSDGAEVTLQPTDRVDPSAVELKATKRFAGSVFRPLVSAPLEDGQFLALIEGVGFVPTGGVRLDLFEGRHVVRGEVTK